MKIQLYNHNIICLIGCQANSDLYLMLSELDWSRSPPPQESVLDSELEGKMELKFRSSVLQFGISFDQNFPPSAGRAPGSPGGAALSPRSVAANDRDSDLTQSARRARHAFKLAAP
jgi:hypothetical protein